MIGSHNDVVMVVVLGEELVAKRRRMPERQLGTEGSTLKGRQV